MKIGGVLDFTADLGLKVSQETAGFGYGAGYYFTKFSFFLIDGFPQAAIVDPVDPDSVVAAVKEEGVRAFNYMILPGVDICPKL